MSNTAQPTYSIAANLRWFAVVYLVALALTNVDFLIWLQGDFFLWNKL